MKDNNYENRTKTQPAQQGEYNQTASKNKVSKKEKKPIHKRWWFWVIIIVFALGIIGSFGSDDENTGDMPISESNLSVAQNHEVASEKKTEETTEETTTVTTTMETTTTETTTKISIEKANALASADLYLQTMAFSKTGLIDQLKYEGYSEEAAKFAVDRCGADWNEQAARMAEQYLNTMSFSRSGLIEQLEYEGFTAEQAEYGVTAVGY